MRYVAVLDGEPGAYGLWIPDFPGCTAAGATPEETLDNAREALRMWAESQTSKGKPVPAARKIEAVRADPDVRAALAAGDILACVPLIRHAHRSIRINISLDAGVIDAIDKAARAAGVTRSSFLARAAQEKISREA